MTKWGSLVMIALCAWLGAGCCPELREFVQKESTALNEEKVYTFEFDAPDCFDTGKEVLFAVLWKSGKHKASVDLEGFEVAKFPAQTCDLVAQAAEALGDAIGGAVGDVVGDLGCAFNLFPGPDFERDDVVAIQELRQDDFEWQVFKLAPQAVLAGKNELQFDVELSTEQCTGEDQRVSTEMAYLLISDVDNACDEKFRD